MTERYSMPYPSAYTEVYGSKMHYVEAGRGSPILLLHSIPLSCYSWRNIIPHLAPLGRCIAPDLIGFGRSERPDIAYTIQDHIKYIDKFIENLNLKNIVIVMHGFGSLLGFNYAMNHEKNCRGLVFYEAFLHSTDNELSLPFQEQVNELQEQDYELVTEGTTFIDRILPQHLMKPLSEEEMQKYREPFMDKGSAKPIIQYIRDLPSGSGKDEVDKLITNYSKKLTKSKLPKLMMYSVPGFVTTIATIMWAKEHLSNLEVVDIGEELHLAQETYPELMGETISVWLQALESIAV